MTTCLTPNRTLALRIGFKATDWPHPIGFDEYLAALSGWDVQVIERDDEPIGAAYFKDGEVHVSVLPEWRKRWATRGILRKLFERNGAFTRVVDGHDHMYGILERLGFKRTSDNMLVKEN